MTEPRLTLGAFRSLGRALRHAPALRGRRIGPRLREQIILHVSSVNQCPVCSVAHEVVGRAVGLDEADVRAARACEPPVDLDDRTRTALLYAEARATDTMDEATSSTLTAHFSSEEREEIDAIVDLFIFNNRANNTWEGLLPGARWRRRKLGLCDR